MAHYALIDENDVVTQVFVGKDEHEPVPEGFASWEHYYCPPTAKACLRTSYNTQHGARRDGAGQPFRGNYAGPGYRYDARLDAFIPPQPAPHFTLNETTFSWEDPTATDTPAPEGG